MAGVPKRKLKTMEMLVRELNVRLKVAWQIIQDETCSMCGVPSWYGRNPDSNLDFEIHDSVCYSCKKLGDEEDKKKDHKHERGVTKYATPVPIMAGTKLPTRDKWLRGISTLADLPEFAEQKNN